MRNRAIKWIRTCNDTRCRHCGKDNRCRINECKFAPRKGERKQAHPCGKERTDIDCLSCFHGLDDDGAIYCLAD